MTSSEYKLLSVEQFTNAALRYQKGWVPLRRKSRLDASVLELLERRPFSNLLDTGCGTGSMIEELAALFPDSRFTGIDLTPRMVTIARRRQLPNAEFLAGDSESLQFSDACFDVVTCINSFRYYPNPDKFFADVNRVLRPGGYLVLLDHTAGPPVLQLMNRVLIPLSHIAGFGGVRWTNPAEIQSLCAAYGLLPRRLERQRHLRLILVAEKPTASRSTS